MYWHSFCLDACSVSCAFTFLLWEREMHHRCKYFNLKREMPGFILKSLIWILSILSISNNHVLNSRETPTPTLMWRDTWWGTHTHTLLIPWLRSAIKCLSMQRACVWLETIPELSVRFELLFLLLLSLLFSVASLVGICCWTPPCLCSWLVVLTRWMGTSDLAGRVALLSRRGGMSILSEWSAVDKEAVERSWERDWRAKSVPEFLEMSPLKLEDMESWGIKINKYWMWMVAENTIPELQLSKAVVLL